MKKTISKIKIGRRYIGPGEPAFIVAEMSGNHSKNYKKAEEIIRAAAKAGADAIKLQTYTPDTITVDSRKPWFMEKNKDNPSAWQGKSMYQLYRETYTPWEWHAPLKKLAESLGLIFFSTPFDVTAVDYLEKTGVKLYKIASYESTDHILLKKVASMGKPVIMSLGYPSRDETDESVKLLRDNGVKDLALLHCVTYYSEKPDPAQSYLATMLDIKDRYGVIVGLSDNNGGIEIPSLAVALGASIIEKHLIVGHGDGGNDAQFSLDSKGFADLVRSIRKVEKELSGLVHEPMSKKKMAVLIKKFPYVKKALGKVVYGPRSKQEKNNMRFRRSLFVVKDVKNGERFTSKNVRSIRPNNGLETKYYDEVLGKRAAKDIERAEPLSWDMVER